MADNQIHGLFTVAELRAAEKIPLFIDGNLLIHKSVATRGYCVGAGRISLSPPLDAYICHSGIKRRVTSALVCTEWNKTASTTATADDCRELRLSGNEIQEIVAFDGITDTALPVASSLGTVPGMCRK